ncbi:MAG: hypothetical protein SPK43_01690 [Candidatus Onthovivens sp.]|nr:hypothetical protein [Candidatus Onthovivens sp.]
MINCKYNLDFSEELFKKDVKRLINQIWKLIPMKEKDEPWEQ